MSDITSLILQAAGGAIVSRAEIHFKKQVGIHGMISGLALQVISLLVFMILCGDFVIAVRKSKRQGEGFTELRKEQISRSFCICMYMPPYMSYGMS